jgi:hypothetical protein
MTEEERRYVAGYRALPETPGEATAIAVIAAWGPAWPEASSRARRRGHRA